MRWHSPRCATLIAQLMAPRSVSRSVCDEIEPMTKSLSGDRRSAKERSTLIGGNWYWLNCWESVAGRSGYFGESEYYRRSSDLTLVSAELTLVRIVIRLGSRRGRIGVPTRVCRWFMRKNVLGKQPDKKQAEIQRDYPVKCRAGTDSHVLPVWNHVTTHTLLEDKSQQLLGAALRLTDCRRSHNILLYNRLCDRR